MKTSKTQYIILPGKITSPNADPKVVSLLDEAYFLWKNIWDSTFKGNGVEKKASPDDFFRQNFIPIIKNETDIIAIHLYSIFNLSSKAMREHSYLKNNFNDKFFSVMEQENIKLAMTMESLIVHPDYRRTKIGQSYFLAISYLGMQLFADFTNCDAIIAPVRRDVGIAEAAEKIGFSATDKNITLYNTPVDLVYLKRNSEIKYPDDIIRQQVKNLWNEKLVYLNSEDKIHFKRSA